MEPDHGADAAQEITVLGAEDRAAAGGEDNLGGVEEFSQLRGLPLPEALLALLGEDLGDAFFRPRGDQVVAVEEVVTEASRQPAADAAFAASHEADQDDVGTHEPILRLPGR